VLSDTIPIDALRCGNRYGIAFGSIGLEAYADRDGSEMMERGTFLPEDFVYVWAGLKSVLKNKKLGQAYTVDLDGQSLDGEYSAILIANGPCYGKNMNPAIDAHPNDGILDIYLTKDMSRLKYITTAPKYVSGNYRKMPGIVRHYRGTKISVASESDMCVCIDGGTYYESTIEYEVVPRAIRLACPKEIDTQKLPRLYNRPEGGYVGEQQKE
jgi:diacylglycerol kinase family enzyme